MLTEELVIVRGVLRAKKSSRFLGSFGGVPFDCELSQARRKFSRVTEASKKS
jgi:hypothetical protein